MAKTKVLKRMPACDDKEMILDPDLWPQWPYLPLKRKNSSLVDKNLGLLLATQEYDDARKRVGSFIVYHVYMSDPPIGREAWDSSPRTEYKNVDELLADGWLVD